MPKLHWNALGPEHRVPVKTVASISNSNVQKIQSEASCLHIPVLFLILSEGCLKWGKQRLCLLVHITVHEGAGLSLF